MAVKKQSAVLDALDKCEDRVRISIRNHLEDIAKFLKTSKIIEHAMYNDVTNPETKETGEIRAKKLYKRLYEMTQGDEDNYHKFVGFLRKDSKFKKIVDDLDDAYNGVSPWKSQYNSGSTCDMHGVLNVFV